ncbi:MAG: lysine-2,3-aminomutase-like protein [Azospirillaceae bacterium]|nr:lysine-2,3-aminomutase-like protein [Azospirillaceae bacterium]
MTTARTVADLVSAGLVVPQQAPALAAVAARYAIAVTPYLQSLIAADPKGPIARQYLPDPRELENRPEERDDPIGDRAHMPVPGVVHRYPDRVLLKLIHACAVYCRFCFRREMVGPGGDGLSPEALEQGLRYIRQHPEIWEVILTGGDPLVLTPRRLGAVVADLAAIDHVAVVRLHTRIPLADPERITAALIDVLRPSQAAVWIAVHCNHPAELTPEACAALARLADAGVPLVSQTVLLRGINDDVATLDQLFRALVRARVKPYYLHHPDLAPGTGHFRLSLAEGQALVRRLRGRLSGLCQPHYVLDIPGGHGKVPVGPGYLHDVVEGGGEAEVEDWQGHRHPYP